MSRWLCPIVVAAICGVVLVGVGQAQTPPSAQPPEISTPAGPENRENRAARGPVQRSLNSHGLGCWSHHTQMGCGSFCSEFRFIFGSCRSFFGDRCIPNPPHSDRDPYWRNPCSTGKCK